MLSVTVFQIIIWLLLKLLEIGYLPLHVIRLFKRPIKLPPITDPILLQSASKLAETIRKKNVSCEAIIKTYINRIKAVNPILNAVIDNRFELALADARTVDKFLASTDLTESEIAAQLPLLGVPLTVKGSVNVEGMNNTSGRPDRLVRAESDAVPVRRARNAGAIPMLTSNTPELCLNWETKNKLIGFTNNPYNSTRTVGGSSGGEASLLASGGSVIGIGSDIAGSLRLPAHFCGVWGHKPSPKLVACDGHYPDCEERAEWVKVFTMGPLARYATDLRLLLNIIAEPAVKIDLKLNERVDLKKINVYYVSDMGSFLAGKASRESREAVKKVVDHLSGVCKEPCTKVQLPLLKAASELSYLSLLQMDGIENLFEGKGIGCYSELFRFFTCRSQHELTSILYGLIRRNLHLLPKSFFKATNKSLQKLRKEFYEMLGNDSVFICPTFSGEAHYHGDSLRNIFHYGRLSIFNALGLPVTSCPISLSNNRLPIGVQVVGSPNCDCLTLSVAEELEKKFGGWTPPSLLS